MACQLQPECNFLHSFFKCKLPMEVVDVEVKITSMQGTHLYKRDQTMQVTKCLLWTNNIQPHPTIIKKMKTFLEVENKMGTIIQTSMPNSQIRPPLPITNPNVCRSDNAERRKTVMPLKENLGQSPQQTHPYHRLHQNLTMKSHPQQLEQTPHGQELAKQLATQLMIDNGLSQKAIQPYKTRKVTMTFPP